MENIQLELNKRFMDLQKKNPRFSLRSYAQKLGVSSGALSEIMSGQRKISKKLALKLADKLMLKPSEKQKFLAAYAEQDSEKTSVSYLRLQDDQFRIISEWPHFAILNLIQSTHAKSTTDWFASRLNLPNKIVDSCIERLLRLNLIVLEDNRFKRTYPRIETSDDVLNLSIQKSVLEDLDMIKESLGQVSVNDRDITSITMLIDPERMPEIKKWIRKKQDQFMTQFETKDSESAFRFMFSLFPLRKPSGGQDL